VRSKVSFDVVLKFERRKAESEDFAWAFVVESKPMEHSLVSRAQRPSCPIWYAAKLRMRSAEIAGHITCIQARDKPHRELQISQRNEECIEAFK
jgi:hypothetical protein